MTEASKEPQSQTATEQARHSVKQAEQGDAGAADRLRRQERTNPQAAEAAEQEVSDGPGKRGVSR